MIVNVRWKCICLPPICTMFCFREFSDASATATFMIKFHFDNGWPYNLQVTKSRFYSFSQIIPKTIFSLIVARNSNILLFYWRSNLLDPLNVKSSLLQSFNLNVFTRFSKMNACVLRNNQMDFTGNPKSFIQFFMKKGPAKSFST